MHRFSMANSGSFTDQRVHGAGFFSIRRSADFGAELKLG